MILTISDVCSCWRRAASEHDPFFEKPKTLKYEYLAIDGSMRYLVPHPIDRPHLNAG